MVTTNTSGSSGDLRFFCLASEVGDFAEEDLPFPLPLTDTKLERNVSILIVENWGTTLPDAASASSCRLALALVSSMLSWDLENG